MRMVFLLGFGLLPAWVALAFIISAFATMRPDHAAMTTWAFVPAIAACAITLPIAFVSSSIYTRTAGDQGRKLRMSGAFLAIAIAILATAAFVFFSNWQSGEKNLQQEKLLVEQFVGRDATVHAAVGAPKTVSVATYSVDRSGRIPSIYDVGVNVLAADSKAIYAIVEVDRNTKPATFRLICLTPLSVGQRSGGSSNWCPVK